MNILFIDGIHRDRDSYTQELKTSLPHYQIYQVSTGQTGLVLYQSHSIDCVILELDLPDGSGFQVLMQLVPMAIRPEVAVIVLTRLNYSSLLDVAKVSGAQAAMRKSEVSGELLDALILQAISNVER